MDPAHQKLAVFKSPKIEFKGDITKMKVLLKIPIETFHLDKIIIFKNYFLINLGNGIAFLEKDTYKIIFKQEFEVEEIHGINILDEDTLIIVAFDKLRIIRFEEKEQKSRAKIPYFCIFMLLSGVGSPVTGGVHAFCGTELFVGTFHPAAVRPAVLLCFLPS